MVAPPNPTLPPRYVLRWLLISLGLIGLGAILYLNQATLIVLAISLFLAYLLDPAIDRLEALGLSRSTGIILMTLAVMIGLGLFGLLVGKQLRVQITQFAALMPQVNQWLATQLIALADALSLPITGDDLQSYMTRLRNWVEANFLHVMQQGFDFFQTTFTSLTNFIVSVLHITLIPALTFYLLRDFDILRERCYASLPPSWRLLVADWAGELDRALGGFLRGQFTIALVLAIIYATGLSLIRVPMGLLLGLVSGLANMVPYMSIVVGLLPSLLLCSLSDNPSLWRFLGVLLIYVGGQTVEGVYLGPRIMGRETGLHPVVVMVAIMVGGTLFGLTGLILSVPATALLRVVLIRWHRAWQATWPPA